jgi:nucleotide-binding universal stress UspA family protein
MTTYVVPLDGSELAERALAVARNLANATQGAVALAQVIAQPWRLDIPGEFTLQLARAAQQYLNDVAARLGPEPVETHVLDGNPADALLTFVAQRQDAVLVMSTHGRGGLDRFRFGSVADKVVRGAATPVVIVPAAGENLADPLTDLLVPLDGSELSAAALPHAVELARALGAELRLVRVVEPIRESFFMYGSPMSLYLSDAQITRLQADADAEANAYLATVAESLADQPASVTQTIRHGNPADELLRLTAEFPHGLLVMATHGRGGLRRWALGSVTTEVLQHASIPVLVTPSSGAHE